jgi:hypothetical protein
MKGNQPKAYLLLILTVLALTGTSLAQLGAFDFVPRSEWEIYTLKANPGFARF